MSPNDLLRDMYDKIDAERRAEMELGTRRRGDYLAGPSRANDIRPPWWRPFARMQHARSVELQSQRAQAIGACDACVSTFSLFNLPCAIHQTGRERELAFELVRARRIRDQAASRELVMFEVGEIINPEDWGLRVQITALDPIEAVVIKNTDPTSYIGKFFPVGKQLRFIRCHLGTSWRIETDDKDMPWYILGIYEGRKHFEHYR